MSFPLNTERNKSQPLKFLFVHSWNGFSLAFWYLREALASGCSVPVRFRSFDLPVAGTPANDIFPRMVSAWQPDILGFSCHYWNLAAVLEAATDAKFLKPDVRIVLGGPQVNSVRAAEEVLSKCPSADYVIRGAGEESLCRLIESLAGKTAPESVPGISLRIDKRYQHAVCKADARWKRGPVFHEKNAEMHELIEEFREISYETISGCVYQCVYCYYPNAKFELLDDDLILSELTYLCSRKVPIIRICDTHFGGTKERAKMLLRHFQKINQCSRIMIYPDLLHVDAEYVRLIRDAGVHATSIGIQTTNTRSLDVVRRPEKHKHIEAIKLMLNAFPDIPADVIIGLPGDDITGLEKTFRGVLDLGFTNVNVFRLMLFPGTELSENTPMYLGEGDIRLSSHGQVLSSPGFPRESQGKIADLVHALEIACRLPATRKTLSGNQSGSHVMDLASHLNSEQLLDLLSCIRSSNSALLRNKFAQIISLIAGKFGGGPDINDAITLDLAKILQQLDERTKISA